MNRTKRFGIIAAAMAILCSGAALAGTTTDLFKPVLLPAIDAEGNLVQRPLDRTYWSLFATYDTVGSDLMDGGVGTGMQIGYEITPIVHLEVNAAFADPAYADGDFQFQSSTTSIVLHTDNFKFYHGLRLYSLATAGGDFGAAGDSFLYGAGGGFEFDAGNNSKLFFDTQHLWRTDSIVDTNWQFRGGLRVRF